VTEQTEHCEEETCSIGMYTEIVSGANPCSLRESKTTRISLTNLIIAPKKTLLSLNLSVVYLIHLNQNGRSVWSIGYSVQTHNDIADLFLA